MNAYTPLKMPGNDEFVAVERPDVDTKLRCGTRVAIPCQTIYMSLRHATYGDGTPVENLTQKQVTEYLKECNARNGTNFRYPALFENMEAIDHLGREHSMFDENFERNGASRRCGYVLDYNRPSNEGMVEGVNQKLVTRVIGYRLPDGDQEMGVTTIAPSGMVPLFTRAELEKRYGASGLKTLEILGVTMPDSKKTTVKPWNALGYPQFTLDHDHREGYQLTPHSHHVWTPGQDDSEMACVWTVYMPHISVLRCINCYLVHGSDTSYPNWSFSLVRGEIVEVKPQRTINKFLF